MTTAKQVSTHAAVAKLIRAELKKRGIAGTVRSSSYSMGNSVHVAVTDLLPADAKDLETFCNQFQYGHFDGSDDSYNYSNSRDDIPQVKFVMFKNNLSDDLRVKIDTFAVGFYGDEFVNASYDQSTITWQLFTGVRPAYWEAQA